MFAVLEIIIGVGLLLVGALFAPRYIDRGVDRDFFSLGFLAKVLAPLLIGGILVLNGLVALS